MVVNRYDRRLMCQIGLVLLAAGSALSALNPAYGLLCLSRGIAGFGGGIAQTIVYATTVHRTNKDKTYAIINILLLVWGAVTIAVAPLLMKALGVGSVFLSFPVMVLLALPLTVVIPRQAVPLAAGAQVGKAPPLTGKSFCLLALFCLLFAGHGVLWVYQERIGVSIGLPAQVIGAILGLSILAGAVGAGAAGIVGNRIGHTTAQIIGFAGAIVASLAIVYGQTLIAYGGAAAMVMAVWFFGLTYLLALTAELDPTGRLSGLANAAIFIGQGLGPVAAATMVGDGNFRMVGWLSASIYAVCLVLAIYVTAGAPRAAGAPAISK
jgi:predicted MFS family arabinose efflux permease